MTPAQITEAQRLADSMAAFIKAGGNPLAVDAIAAMELLRTLAAQAAQDQKPAVEWECKEGGLKPLTQAQYLAQHPKIQLHYTRIAPAVDVDALMELADDYAHTHGGSYERAALRAALEGLK